MNSAQEVMESLVGKEIEIALAAHGCWFTAVEGLPSANRGSVETKTNACLCASIMHTATRRLRFHVRRDDFLLASETQPLKANDQRLNLRWDTSAALPQPAPSRLDRKHVENWLDIILRR